MDWYDDGDAILADVEAPAVGRAVLEVSPTINQRWTARVIGFMGITFWEGSFGQCEEAQVQALAWWNHTTREGPKKQAKSAV